MAGSAEVIKNLYNWANMKKAGVEGATKVAAASMQTYARQNKPWKDQTGNARAGLHGGYLWEKPDYLKAYIAHSVSYGLYLEMAHDRKNKILEEARDSVKDSWYNSVKKIMETNL